MALCREMPLGRAVQLLRKLVDKLVHTQINIRHQQSQLVARALTGWKLTAPDSRVYARSGLLRPAPEDSRECGHLFRRLQ